MLFTFLLWSSSALAGATQTFVSDCRYADVAFSDDGAVVWTHVAAECEIKAGVRAAAGSYVGWYKKDWEGPRVGPAIGKLAAETEILPGIRAQTDSRWAAVIVAFLENGDLSQINKLAANVDLGCGVIAAKDEILTFSSYGKGLPYALTLAKDLTVDGETFRAGEDVFFNINGHGSTHRPQIFHDHYDRGFRFDCTDWKYKKLKADRH